MDSVWFLYGVRKDPTSRVTTPVPLTTPVVGWAVVLSEDPSGYALVSRHLGHYRCCGDYRVRGVSLLAHSDLFNLWESCSQHLLIGGLGTDSVDKYLKQAYVQLDSGLPSAHYLLDIYPRVEGVLY